MARDIVPLDPWKDKCPWCHKPLLIERSLAVYEGGEAEQFEGLKKDGRVSAEAIRKKKYHPKG